MEPSDPAKIEIAAETDKTCATCRSIKGVRTRPELANTWRCWKTLITKQRNPVTGEIDFYFTKENCLATRKDPEYCGPEGKWYELYEAPVYREEQPKIGGMEAKLINIDALTNLNPSADTFSPIAQAEIAARAKAKINESRIKRGLQPLP